MCVCVRQDQKHKKMLYEKEKVITSKNSCNVQTTILQINYTETKCSRKANMSKHRMAKNKKHLLVYSLGYSNAKHQPKITIV